MQRTGKTKSLFISAVNIDGPITHFALRIKPGAKLSGLSDEVKASLRKKISEVNLLMMNEIFMISRDLWAEIDVTLSEIFSASIELPFCWSFSGGN